MKFSLGVLRATKHSMLRWNKNFKLWSFSYLTIMNIIDEIIQFGKEQS